MLEKKFKVMGDPVRLEILDLLRREGQMNAGEIADRFDLTNATISYHLKLLKEEDLIFERKEKNFIYYELNTTIFDDLLSWLMKFGKGEDDEK